MSNRDITDKTTQDIMKLSLFEERAREIAKLIAEIQEPFLTEFKQFVENDLADVEYSYGRYGIESQVDEIRELAGLQNADIWLPSNFGC